MTLRRLIPLILLITGIANVALRFLPPSRFTFRSWEAATLFAGSIGPFATGMRYYNAAAYGDLAPLANMMQYAVPHRETFATGAHGYRTWEPGLDPPAAAAVIGDSFSAGASLADDEYFCKQLERVFHGPVFFASHLVAEAPERLRRTKVPPFVVLQLSERFLANPGHTSWVGRILPDDSPLYIELRYLKDFTQYSPLEILAGKSYRALQNDVILPNIFKNRVGRYTLRNHAEMLFLRSEIDDFFAPPPAPIDGLLAVLGQIESAGPKTIVVLVPNKCKRQRKPSVPSMNLVMK